MAFGTARSVGESHRDGDGDPLSLHALDLKVLGDAVGARHLGGFERAFDPDADGVNRSFPGLMIREIGNDAIDQPLGHGIVHAASPAGGPVDTLRV